MCLPVFTWDQLPFVLSSLQLPPQSDCEASVVIETISCDFWREIPFSLGALTTHQCRSEIVKWFRQ